MKPGNFIIQLIQGAVYDKALRFKNKKTGIVLNLTGYTAALQARFKVTDTTPVFEMTTENGRIVIDGVNGLVTLHLTPEETAAFSWGTPLVYDLFLIPASGDALKFLKGTVALELSVTRL